MSASLVGSEMCIRDSQAQLSTRKWLKWISGRFVWQLACQQVRPLGPFCTCLLYTSDAADDM
eukprot:7241993-Alexandrium_andersonii.AAC.1